MNKVKSALLCIGLIFGAAGGFTLANESTPKNSKRSHQPVEIKAVPWGPNEQAVDAAKRRAEQSAAVRDLLKGAKYRLVGFEYIDETGADKSRPSMPPTRYRVFFYDYTNAQTIIAESDFAAKEPVTVRKEIYDPGVGGKEMEAAIELVKKDSIYGKLYSRNQLEIFEAMPPVSNLNGERLVNIGIRNMETGEEQIAGISFKNDKIISYENNSPPSARVNAGACGVTNAGQAGTGPGIPGQLMVTFTQNNATIWEMLVVRPSASSGHEFERSGIEVRDVKYKGKSVLKRGHAPILNVKYVNDACGPFRDWQFAEGFFDAPVAGANDPVDGFRVLGTGQVATTVVESRNDFGNFQGVAVYTQNVGNGDELVLVTEMNAGWYRYIMEWRFAPDGTIRPRYGFGSVTNGCVCAPRTHHVYWRFDFDIVSPNNKLFKVERGRKFLTSITNETTIFRNFQLKRAFLVQNANGDEAYQITPNLIDGSVATPTGNLIDTFGAGDLWFLRFKGTANDPAELDDPNPQGTFAANLAPWVNNESLVNQDVVVWYAAHQTRVDDASRSESISPEVLQGRHIVGPDLRPVRW